MYPKASFVLGKCAAKVVQRTRNLLKLAANVFLIQRRHLYVVAEIKRECFTVVCPATVAITDNSGELQRVVLMKLMANID